MFVGICLHAFYFFSEQMFMKHLLFAGIVIVDEATSINKTDIVNLHHAYNQVRKQSINQM